MKSIYYFLSNRCSYERSKILLDKINEEFDLSVIISGALSTEAYKDLEEEITKTYNTVNIRVNCYTNTLEDMAAYSAQLSMKMWDILMARRPDMVILWADRFELLPVAMVCNYMGIPIAHIQGGETTGNVDNYVRKAVSVLSTYHFVSHSDAMNNLVTMGCKHVWDTGCPSIDVIKSLNFEKPNHDYIISIFHPHTEELSSIKRQTNIYRDSVVKFCEENKLSLYWFAPNSSHAGCSKVVLMSSLDLAPPRPLISK